MKINFMLNGSEVALETDPLRRLLDVLREDFDASDAVGFDGALDGALFFGFVGGEDGADGLDFEFCSHGCFLILAGWIGLLFVSVFRG